MLGFINGTPVFGDVETRAIVHDPHSGQFTGNGGSTAHAPESKAKPAKEKSSAALRKEAVSLSTEAKKVSLGHYGAFGQPPISKHPNFPEWKEKTAKAHAAWETHFKHAPSGEQKAKDLAKMAEGTLGGRNLSHHEAQHYHGEAAKEYKTLGNTEKAKHHESMVQWHGESARHEELKSHYAEWEKHRTPEQKQAIKDYAYGMDSAINNSLRHPTQGARGVGHVVKELDGALANTSAPHAFTAYRTVGPEMASRFKVGTEFHDPGFGSTSTGEHRYTPLNQHSWVKMHIDVPKGARGAPIAHLHPDELEFLLPRGSRFKVKSISEEDRGPHPKLPGVRMKTTHVHVDLVGS